MDTLAMFHPGIKRERGTNTNFHCGSETVTEYGGSVSGKSFTNYSRNTGDILSSRTSPLGFRTDMSTSAESASTRLIPRTMSFVDRTVLPFTLTI